MTQLDVLKDTSEIVHYEIADYPFYCRYGNLSSFTGKSALCHWHDDLEFIRALKGHMSYSVNGKSFTLQEGEAILINSRQLHYGYSADGTDCEYICILFHPGLLTTNSYLERSFIRPVSTHPAFSQMLLRSDAPDDRRILTLYQKIEELHKTGAPGYELQIQSLLNAIWLALYRHFSDIPQPAEMAHNKELAILQDMIDFIHNHYPEKLTLEDIAKAGGVCRSRCCHIFKEYLRQSPGNFLTGYRLEQSITLLISSPAPITDISLSCGFTGPSYFTETFRRYKGCTPTEYREIARRKNE